MSPSLTVRRIAADQGAVLRELRTASLRDAPYAFGDATLEDALLTDAAVFDAAAARYADSHACTSFILYTEGHPAGLIGATFETEPTRRAVVSALWVAPAVRHLRGGELLLNAAIDWLIAEGATQVFAWITDNNTTAMRFYERLGFVATGDHVRSKHSPEQWEMLLVREVASSVRSASSN
ncbi:MAG: GNAT family N-acetyltransferase [Paraburkholderia sp.]|uniref:GNAT family N-acetyltransferase n=1 Tax=Paraburkholderia sp. TaxID=1926495 RepID=UPI0011F42944|nr:GNAT family N-acetyltransferase [Paraburkholderia sp.]TAM02833.1 MAG: GNAT family N-acetyltransferase [Paraburkholderia sp.]TAM28069.1 MAG: GNAT family N-acetyltransferase [Paraburkholderia sp.]